MSSAGFYLMHRGWQSHPLFRDDEFSRRDAFVWMIEQAAYAERRVGTGQGTITIARGQFSHSIRYMAKAWGWDPRKVQRFLKACSDDAMIVQETATGRATGQTLITIRNYAKYQVSVDDSATANATEALQQRHSSATNKKEGKEGKEGKDSPTAGAKRLHPLPPDFAPVLTEAARATVAKWPPGMLERELDQFKDRAIAKGETYKDWQAAFRTWIRNANTYRGQGNGSYRNGTGTGHGQVNGFRAAIRRATAVLGPDDDG